MQKSDFEILMYLYVFRYPEFSFAVFAMMCKSMLSYAYICMHVSEHGSVFIVVSEIVNSSFD